MDLEPLIKNGVSVIGSSKELWRKQRELKCLESFEYVHLRPFRYDNFAFLGWDNTGHLKVPFRGTELKTEFDRYDFKGLEDNESEEPLMPDGTMHCLFFAEAQADLRRFSRPQMAHRFVNSASSPVYTLDERTSIKNGALWKLSDEDDYLEDQAGHAHNMPRYIDRKVLRAAVREAFPKGLLRKFPEIERFLPELMREERIPSEAYALFRKGMESLTETAKILYSQKYPNIYMHNSEAVADPDIAVIERGVTDFRTLSREQRFPVITKNLFCGLLVTKRRGYKKRLFGRFSG